MKSAIRSMSNEKLRELSYKHGGGPYASELRRRSNKQMKRQRKGNRK